MSYTMLISAVELARQLPAPNWIVLDCRHDLAKPDAGRADYGAGHIPNAQFAHLDTNLADHMPASDGVFHGRHPLPAIDAFIATLRRWGVNDDSQVVAYDAQGGMFAARLWWMLRWAGHEAVAVLDGGLKAWQESGGEVTDREETSHFQSNFKLGRELRKLVTADEVVANLGKRDFTLVDARAGARYRGEVEPLDPVAGHIPGALNRPGGENMEADGRFKPAAQLREEFEKVLAGRDPSSVVHHCGSGVSAVPNIVAMEVAGLGPTALFAGSWSEWVSDASRPVATGPKP